MKTPYLNPIQTNKPMLNSFAGINRGERIDYAVNQTTVGEWADAENLTTEQYPVAMTRERRVVKELRSRLQGSTDEGTKSPLFEGEGQDACEVDGNVYVSYWSGSPDNIGYVAMGADRVATAGKPRQIVKFGRGVFTSDGTFIPYSSGSMTAQNVAISQSAQMNVEVADASGRSLTSRWLYTGTQPDNPDHYSQDSSWATVGEAHPVVDVPNGAIWFDSVYGGEYKYDITSDNWDFIGDSYVLLVGANLHKGDFVHVECTSPLINGDYTVVKSFTQIGTYNTSANPIVQVTWNCALIKLTIPYGATSSQGTLVKVKRRCPIFDYICSHRNRIWGCRYGLNDEGEFVNEIYASELNNATNFFRFANGIADESWMASVGTGGAWTGCAAVEDNVYFFKEDRIFMVTGTDPSNFSYKEIEGPGVAPGMYKTIIVKDGSIYYAATRGIYRINAYNYPVCIDDKRRKYLGSDSVGVSDKDVLRWADYYKVVVYDMKLDAWMEEQGLGVYPFAALHSRSNPLVFCNDPYYDEEEETTVSSTDVVLFHDMFIDTTLPTPSPFTILGQTYEFFWENVFEGRVSWYAETGLKGLGDPEPKRVKNLKIRLKTDEDTSFKVFIKLDEDDTWIPISDEKRAKAGTYLVRYVPDRRCDIYRLRFEGTGHTVIYSITEEYENAGDVSVGL